MALSIWTPVIFVSPVTTTPKKNDHCCNMNLNTSIVDLNITGVQIAIIFINTKGKLQSELPDQFGSQGVTWCSSVEGGGS